MHALADQASAKEFYTLFTEIDSRLPSHFLNVAMPTQQRAVALPGNR